MAAPGEVDKDLKIEIEDECNKKYGNQKFLLNILK